MEKTIVIMRGISGSGKSTYIENQNWGGYVCSADHFFLDQEGDYLFDYKKVSEAHQFCLSQFIEAIHQKTDMIIVDNTNAKKWQYENYAKLAKMQGYNVMYKEMMCPDRETVWAYWQRNSHDTPIQVCMNMWNKWEQDERFEKIETKLEYQTKLYLVRENEKDLPRHINHRFSVYEVPKDFGSEKNPPYIPHISQCGLLKAFNVNGNWFGPHSELIMDMDAIMEYDLLL